MARQKRRRQLLVDRKIQVGLSARIIACMAAYMMLFGLVAVMGPLFAIATGMPGDDEVIAAGDKLNGLFSTFLIPAILTFACLAMHCFIMLHRIAGPAYRFRTVLAAIRDRDISGRVRLRDGDLLVDVAESMDETVARLREDFEEMRREAVDLVDTLDGRADGGGGPDVGAAKDGARKLLDRISRYRTERPAQTSAPGLDEAEDTRVADRDEVREELETPV